MHVYLRHVAPVVMMILLISAFTPTIALAQRSGFGGRNSSETQQKINALPETASADVTIPILFGVEVANLTRNFGDPRSGGRTHEGLDIMAPRGTPIVSPTQAVVTRTGVGSSAGNYVNTANPGGESFVYMHLDTIADGVTGGKELARGDIIGYVGNTGNAAGGATHLHFEIRKNRTPSDPFLRLTQAFTQEERLMYISNILAHSTNAVELAKLLVTNFRSTFTNMGAQAMTLPSQIVDALVSVPVGASPTPATTLPAGDLEVGSSGKAVAELQQFLITHTHGAAGARLAAAGATGYFGSITRDALVEYQVAESIQPADGYFGPVTRAHVAAAALHSEGEGEDEVDADVPEDTSNTSVVFSRNLYRGITGEDVRALQVLLNQKGFTIASAGEAGSSGHETTYFGNATEQALIKFQIASSITPAVGYFGPITRALANS